MAVSEDKENIAPFTSSDPLQRKGTSPSPKKVGKKACSKSIGPGGLEEPEPKKDDAKNRRKSAFPVAARGILPNKDDEERKAARRKSLAARRVSFAPEATLHTWDVIFDTRSEHTNSTNSPDSTRRSMRSSSPGSPFKHPSTLSSDEAEPPSTPPEQEDEPSRLPPSPAPQRGLHQKKRRRSSTVPPLNFNNPDDELSSSGMSGSSDVSDSEGDEIDGSHDETGTAMSLDKGDNTEQSVATSEGSSTSSTLERNLRQAAEMAGTRGIEYDENGEMSMELAGDEVTNAFQPWAQRAGNQPAGSASMDQENVNPFSPAFKAQLVSGLVTRAPTIEEEDEQDMSMDVTKAIAGILKPQAQERASSPLGDGTMDMTRAIGKLHSIAPEPLTGPSGKKRRRSTTDAGSPGAAATPVQSKRRRSSVARSSMGDDTMDLTVAIGGIQDMGSPVKSEHGKSVQRRRSAGIVSASEDDANVELTRVVGGIRSSKRQSSDSYDEPSEFSMELTTALGSIRPAVEAALAMKASEDTRPMTPQTSLSPPKEAATTTPKDQQRFYNARDSSPKKLLTPIFRNQVQHSAEKPWAKSSEKKSAHAASPLPGTVSYPELPQAGEYAPALRTTPGSPPRHNSPATANNDVQELLDAQLQAPVPSPSVQKQIRSTPFKAVTPAEDVSTPGMKGTPQKDAAQAFADSLRLMGTPRKETLKVVTPKKQPTPRKIMTTPKARSTPKEKPASVASPVRQLSDDLARAQSTDKPVPKVRLQEFLDMANIKFMDLTTTKRRLTTAPTPLKLRRGNDDIHSGPEGEPDINIESAVVAAACTIPELEMYQHACRELKHYTAEGKAVIKELEAETYRETPPLIRAYLAAAPDRKAAIDSQLREMKTHARHRSKEMWYAWRGQLLDDLMKGLQGIAEGLIADDDTLRQTEQALDLVLPGLVEQEAILHKAAERLQEAAASISEEEKEELETARERLVAVDAELEEKRRVLQQLQQDVQEQESQANELLESKAEFTAAIQEAERAREACRSISLDEIADLKESIQNYEETFGWTISSASKSPPTVTMTYKSQLQLFFHPAAFQTTTASSNSRPNAPISLTYIGDSTLARQRELTTALRFHLQLLRASLQALPQCTICVPNLLNLVSSGWETALLAAEAERRLSLEGPTDVRIVSDERLSIASVILLPKLRTKVKVGFEVLAAVGEGLELSTTVEAVVQVVYGKAGNATRMTEFVRGQIDAFEGWNGAVKELRERLAATGAKAMRRKS